MAAHVLRGLLSLALVLVACCARPGAPPPRTLTVFAASSLRPVFLDLEKKFEAQHPGVDVVLAFAGSHQLRAQIAHGARADVFASADPRQLDALAERGLASPPRVFAHNELVIAARADAPVRGLEDLAHAQRIVLAAPEVPLGRYTQELLARGARDLGDDFPARVRARVVSWELSAASVVAKVELGEADAAIAYRSDALRVGQAVRVLRLPQPLRVRTPYAVAPLTASGEPELANAWIELLASARGPVEETVRKAAPPPTPSPPPR